MQPISFAHSLREEENVLSDVQFISFAHILRVEEKVLKKWAVYFLWPQFVC